MHGLWRSATEKSGCAQVVYQDDEVVFRQLDEHTWIGNGHRVYNESLPFSDGAL